MPKHSIDYSNTIIYKIVCKDPLITDLYIGHTTNLIKRKTRHKYCCNTKTFDSYNFYVYQFIRNNGGWENWYIIEIEQRNCINLQDALKCERFWIETLLPTLNKQVPTRTDNEYYVDNKSVLSENAKKKYICECGSNIRQFAKVRHFHSKKHIKYIQNHIA